MPWKKVNPGQPTSAGPYRQSSFTNVAVDLANAFQAGTLTRPSGSSSSGGDDNIIEVKNLTGATLKRGDAFKVGDYLLDGRDFHIWRYEALEIDTTFSRRYAIAAEPIKENATGPAVLYGKCLVHYEGTDPTPESCMGPKPGEVTLFTGYPGILTVHEVIDTTKKWLLGTLREVDTLLCKSVADNAAGALATDVTDYKIYTGTAGSEADSGFTTVPAIYAREATSNNEFFTAKLVNNTWYADIATGRVLMYKCKLNGALATTDASATIDNVTCFGGGTAPSPTSATNTLDLAGADNDDALIIKDGTGYYLVNVMHHDCD